MISYEMTAWRELQEEIGLTHNDVELSSGVCFDEKTNKGSLSVRYFVGHLTKEKHVFTFDTTELAHVDWYSIDNALNQNKLRESRKNILLQAYSLFTYM